MKVDNEVESIWIFGINQNNIQEISKSWLSRGSGSGVGAG
jgi:hypothetical protein